MKDIEIRELASSNKLKRIKISDCVFQSLSYAGELLDAPLAEISGLRFDNSALGRSKAKVYSMFVRLRQSGAVFSLSNSTIVRPCGEQRC